MKAKALLELCITESKTSSDGKSSHSHREILDENGVLTSLEDTNNHSHGVVVSDQGDISIKSAGNSHPKDPEHDHDPSDEAMKSTKDAYLKSFDKDE